MRATNHPLGDHLARRLVEDRDRRLVRVHVKTDPTDTGITVWTLSTYGLAQAYVVSLWTRTPSSDSFTSILARSDTTARP
jgi:hypothetical protein